MIISISFKKGEKEEFKQKDRVFEESSARDKITKSDEIRRN